MSWLAVNGFSGSADHGKLVLVQDNDVWIPKGSIICEFTPSSHKPLRLVHYQSEYQWSRGVTIFRNADGSVSLDMHQGPDRSYANLTGFGKSSFDPCRITYAWNAPAALGQLTLENLTTGNIQQTAVSMPTAMPLQDGLCIIGSGSDCHIDPCVNVLALADHIVPVGPSATITPNAPVLTPSGHKPIRTLRAGDKVVTESAGIVPVRKVVSQYVPAFGNARPVQLQTPFFGLNQDLTMSANQRLLISGVEMEYEFGIEGMMIEVGELVGLPGTANCGHSDLIQYYQILLDSHECINVCDIWTESLFIGKMALEPEVARSSILSDVPHGDLPLHRKRARPLLRKYERQALFGAMSA